MSNGVTESLTLRPIGRVTRGRAPGAKDDAWEEAESQIEIDAAWADALDGIDEFSHVWLLWWLDRAEGGLPETLHVRPERRPDMPLLGLFATRSPVRPNPVAITAVRLLERQGALLRVAGLDAFQGTLVLDIKPYLRRGDLIPEATAPGWIQRLWQAHDQGSPAPDPQCVGHRSRPEV